MRISVAELLHAGEVGESAEWFLQVSPKAPEYAPSQISAGLSLWSLAQEDIREDYLPAAGSIESARDALLRGIEVLQKQPTPPRETLFYARVSAAEIALHQGRSGDALGLLQAEPLPVAKLIEPEAGKERPGEGLNSAPVAQAVYRLLLRAYLGTKQLEPAAAAMKQLETLSGSDSASLSGLYYQLGQQLIEDFGAADAARKPELAAAIDQLLANLQRHTDLQPALDFWAGENLYRVAEQVGDVPDGAAYYNRSAEFIQRYLAAVDAKKVEITAAQQLAIRARLAAALRGAGKFDGAIEIFASMLKESANRFAVQMEAARTLQAWGMTDGNEAKLLEAIEGLGKESNVWGWGKIGIYLERRLYEANRDASSVDQLFAARRAIAESRLAYAERTTDAEAGKKQLEFIVLELGSFYSLHPSLENAGWPPLEAAYQQALQKLGRPDEPLRKPQPTAE
ncbi:MAG: hypothetical protein R3B90_21155 [Planctomycetaceae bacterium]